MIDITDVLSCENKEVCRTVSIELESFQSKMGDFPILNKSPIAISLSVLSSK